jgi:hypothetical protein
VPITLDGITPPKVEKRVDRRMEILAVDRRFGRRGRHAAEPGFRAARREASTQLPGVFLLGSS